MPVRLIRPYAGQAAGTLLWASDAIYDALRGTGSADDQVELASDYAPLTRIVSGTAVGTSRNATVYKFTGAAAATLTLGLSGYWQTGTVLTIEQLGSGAVTVVGSAGVTINTASGSLVTSGQYSIVQITKEVDGSWTSSAITSADINAAGGDPTQFRILVDGDSLGFGQGTTDPGPNGTTGWVPQMVARLPAYLSIPGFSVPAVTAIVTNKSVGGSYSGSSFNRLVTDIQTVRPRIVLLPVTPNDARIDGGNANLMDTAANFRRMIGLVRLYGAVPIVITTAPIDGTKYTPAGIYDATSNAKLSSQTDLVLAVAAEQLVQVINVRASVSNNPAYAATYKPDGIHENDAGAAITGDTIARGVAGQPAIKVFGADLASDTFTRANSTTTMGSTETGALTYSALAGTWGISSNTAYMATGANGRVSLETSVVNHEMQADVVLGTGGAGVEVRQVDASNSLVFYYLGSGTFRLRIGKWVAGALTTLASSNALDALTGTHSLRLSASGSTLTGYLDGARTLSYVLTTAEATIFGAATKAGLYAQSPSVAAASFDNLVVRTL